MTTRFFGGPWGGMSADIPAYVRELHVAVVPKAPVLPPVFAATGHIETRKAVYIRDRRQTDLMVYRGTAKV